MKHTFAVEAKQFNTMTGEDGPSTFHDVDIAGNLTVAGTITPAGLAGTGVFITESADAAADTAGVGQIWVDNLTPNVLKFTDDAGTDHSVLMADGTVATDVVTATAEASEHGAGAIGTGVAPRTYRWIEQGVIITQIKFDLQGLASVADADDVIGLAAGGAAYWGRYVVATYGVVFKVEKSWIETPAGGDNDVDLRTSSSAAGAYDSDGAAYGSVLNSGDCAAGQTKQSLVPALTPNDYFYLTAGTGDTAATYTAGQGIITFYGHPVLT